MWSCIYHLSSERNGTFDIPNFVASYSDQSMQGRITDNCDTGGASFSFETISNISEELDEGYAFEGSVDYDSSPHVGVITSITEAQNVTIQASGNNLQYSVNGTDWIDMQLHQKQLPKFPPIYKLELVSDLVAELYQEQLL